VDLVDNGQASGADMDRAALLVPEPVKDEGPSPVRSFSWTLDYVVVCVKGGSENDAD
jgi:hypothetical protein